MYNIIFSANCERHINIDGSYPIRQLCYLDWLLRFRDEAFLLYYLSNSVLRYIVIFLGLNFKATAQLDVTNFGAIPDDNNDDLLAISNAIGNATSGQYIFFPSGKLIRFFFLQKGVYLVSDILKINLRSSIELRGASNIDSTNSPSSKLHFTNGYLYVNGGSEITITQLHIISNSTCLEIENTLKSQIKRSEFGPCHGVGVHIVLSSNILVVDSYIHPEYRPATCCDRNNKVFLFLIVFRGRWCICRT